MTTVKGISPTKLERCELGDSYLLEIRIEEVKNPPDEVVRAAAGDPIVSASIRLHDNMNAVQLDAVVKAAHAILREMETILSGGEGSTLGKGAKA